MLALSNDTYAMAFKAMHAGVKEDLNLTEEDRYQAYYAASMVFFIQGLMIIFVLSVICGPTFNVCFPNNVYSLGARFVCSILMHLTVSFDTAQGITMMKYSANHSSDFINPKTAFTIGLMQCFGGIAAESLCLLYLTNITNTMDTVIKFMALASIAKVDDWYSGALAGDYVLKKKVNMPFKKSRKEI